MNSKEGEECVNLATGNRCAIALPGIYTGVKVLMLDADPSIRAPSSLEVPRMICSRIQLGRQIYWFDLLVLVRTICLAKHTKW